MQRILPLIAVLVCACDSHPDAGKPDTDVAADTISQDLAGVESSNPVQPALDSASPQSTTSDLASAGETSQAHGELQKLGAARQMVLTGSGEEISASEFDIDDAGSPAAYAGAYHFGDSEGESTLTLTVQGNSVTGTLGYADWENDTWVPKRVQLDGGTIEGARLGAPGWEGVFVRYRGELGLLILRAPTNQIGVEFGEKADQEQ